MSNVYTYCQWGLENKILDRWMFYFLRLIDLDLSRFDAAPLIAFTATKEIDYEIETDGCIATRCGVDRTGQRAYTQASGG
jgi:hypothetical protein